MIIMYRKVAFFTLFLSPRFLRVAVVNHLPPPGGYEVVGGMSVGGGGGRGGEGRGGEEGVICSIFSSSDSSSSW